MIEKALGPLKKQYGKPVVLYELVTTTPNRATRTISNVYNLHFVPKAVVVPKSFINTDQRLRQQDLGFFTRLQGELYIKKSDLKFDPDKLDSVEFDGERFELKKLTVDTSAYWVFALAGYTDKSTHTGKFQISLTDRVNLHGEVVQS